MTSKELREFEEGRSYGNRHPAKVAGWFKSAAWNSGLKAGQAEYWKGWKQKQARVKAYRERQRRRQKALKSKGSW